MLRRFAGGLAALALAAGLAVPARALAPSAGCAILMEMESGRVLYQAQADQPRPIASTTKLMTALVALELGPGLEEQVTVPPEAAGVEGSSLYLKAGETLRFETLMYGMLLHSGNDAAVAAAVLCAGSVEAFAEKMNEKARALGMTNTHFTNPTGLDEEGHYSTARDLALLARACLDQETLARMAATPSITLEGRSFVNHNKLLWRYQGCVGLKTGYTQQAGRTLVSAARREDMTLIAVTLDDPNDWADHQGLFDYGFATYHMETALSQGEEVLSLPVSGGLVPFAGVSSQETVRWPVKAGETLSLQWDLGGLRGLTAPTQAGVRLGTAEILLDGTAVARAPLVCSVSLHRDRREHTGLLARLLDFLFSEERGAL